jgi:6-phosphogluconolactonase (cycloisomerase 2 family)
LIRRQAPRVAIAAALAAVAALAATAFGATGALTPRGCVVDNDTLADDCAQDANGLDTVASVAASPDGKSVYAASNTDNAIVRFDRSTTTGALTPQGCIEDEDVGPDDCAQIAPGLEGATSVAVSPDGKSVYAASITDDAVVRFDRDSSGALTQRGCADDNDTGADNCGAGNETNGLDGANSVAVSPDNKSVYVASNVDDAVVRFDRNTTSGAVTPQGCVDDDDSGADNCGIGNETNGLDGAAKLTVSPDNRSVYAVSDTDDAIVRFDRSTTTGALTPQGCVRDNDTVGDECGAGNDADGLDGAGSVAVSPDNRSVYVASFFDNAVVRLDRNTTTGAVTPAGCVEDDDNGPDGCTQSSEGLTTASTVAVSPDGKSVYAAGTDGIARFDRDATGALTPEGCVEDNDGLGLDSCPQDSDGLSGAIELTITADGKSVLVASFIDDAVVRLDREDPPETRIDSGPSGHTADNTPTYRFSSDESGVSFECGVDGGEFAACNSPRTIGPLPDGPHTFRVRARDSFGTVDLTPAQRSVTVDTRPGPVTVDTTPPETTVVSGPKRKVKLKRHKKRKKARFEFSSSEAGSSFECSLDGTAFEPCTSPVTEKVKKGRHSFDVRASDQLGNTDATPAEWLWKVKKKQRKK